MEKNKKHPILILTVSDFTDSLKRLGDHPEAFHFNL